MLLLIASMTVAQGEIAGVRYLERMTGSARPGERAPMLVLLHAMDGDPESMLRMFQGFPHRARLVALYGHPGGGMYRWFNAVGDDATRSEVTRAADRVAGALAALASARPTLGKPLVAGFSQGGMMTFALAVTHPDAIAAAFPISGLLPLALYPSSTSARSLPPVTAFHGAADLAVPAHSARESIAALRGAGYTAELREYAGVQHDTSGAELREIFERIGRALPR